MTDKNKQFISAVVYVHNCVETIQTFLASLYGVLSDNFEDFEIICVNDASTDGSKEAISDFAKNRGGAKNDTLRRVSHATRGIISLINMSFYQGIEAVMRAGVDLAIGDFVFEFDDAVMDYEPEFIMTAYNRCLEGVDIVSCGTGTSRASSKLFYSLYNRNSGTQYALRSETFRVVSRRAINRVRSMSVNTPYRKALYSNCGLKAEYIKYEPTDAGAKHKQAIKNPADTALTSLILFTNIAYKVAIALTVFMMVLLLGGVAWTITVYLMGLPFSGYTTIMLLIAGSFFALFAVLAIVIKYLSVILDLVFRRQSYIIEGVEKLD